MEESVQQGTHRRQVDEIAVPETMNHDQPRFLVVPLPLPVQFDLPSSRPVTLRRRLSTGLPCFRGRFVVLYRPWSMVPPDCSDSARKLDTIGKLKEINTACR